MRYMYLDANAHVPMSEVALKAYTEFNNTPASHGHPLSPSQIGRAASLVIEEARDNIAKLIGAKNKDQIFFTSGCTQACEWVAKLLNKDETFSSILNISPIEHPAMAQAMSVWESNYYEVSGQGVVIPTDNGCGYGICIHMQNEIGTIQPIGQLTDVEVISDMSQSLGKMEIDVTKLNVDYAVFGAHKFGGPGGVGFMYLKDTSNWREFGTGSRYFMDGPGTPNVGGIVATSAALSEATKTLPSRREKMAQFQNHLEEGLKGLGFEVIGEKAERCPNTTFVKVPGKTNAGLLLMNKLGKKNIHVGLGSACGSVYLGGSPLMDKLGRPSDGQEYIRISQWGEYDANDANYVLEQINGTI